MEENTLNSLPQEVAAPAPVVSEVVATTEPSVEKKGIVDETPDPAKLKAEIEELASKRKKAEEDAIYWRKQKAEARADYFRGRETPGETIPPVRQTPPGIGPEPKPSDFEDYDKFVVALTDHRVKVARAEWEAETSRKQQEQSTRERSQTLQSKLQEGFQKYPDFEEVAFDRTATHITPMIVDILADCDHPADLAYYLAKNRVEGVAISRMTPIQASRAIAKLEIKLTSESAKTPPPSKKSSNAPAPINPLGGGGAAEITKDPDKMTPREFNEWRKSQGARPY